MNFISILLKKSRDLFTSKCVARPARRHDFDTNCQAPIRIGLFILDSFSLSSVPRRVFNAVVTAMISFPSAFSEVALFLQTGRRNPTFSARSRQLFRGQIGLKGSRA